MELFGGVEPTLHSRDQIQRRLPIPDERIQLLTGLEKSILKRQSSSDSYDATTPAGSDSTPVIIGVVIPVLIVAIILFVVWKRRQRIVQKHKGHDKYRSLDYGVDESALLEKKGRKKHNGPEMTAAAPHSTGRQRGISMDLGPANPYLLPPEVASSRESIHSLSRSVNTGDDKYRATTFVPDDGSMRSPSSLRNPRDDTSSWTGSSHLRYGYDADSRTDLLPPKSHLLPESPHISKPPSIVERPPKGLLPPTPDTARNSTTSAYSTGPQSEGLSHNSVGHGPEANSAPVELDANYDESHMPSMNPSIPVQEPQELPAVYAPDEQPKRQSNYHEPQQAQNQVAELEDMDYSYLAHYQDEPPAPKHQEPTIPEIRTTAYEMDDSQHPAHPMPTRDQENRSRETSQNRQRVPPRMQPPGQRGREDSQTRQRGRPNQNRGPQSRERSQHGQRHPSQRPDHRNQHASQHMPRPPPPRQNQHDRQSSRPSDRAQQPRKPPQLANARSRQTSGTISEIPPTPTTVGTQNTPRTGHDEEDDYDYGAGLEDYAAFIGYTYRGSMIRPLPPDDPTENPEQRANRIRSFYKEYFDESSAGSKPSQGRQTGYYDGTEDFDASAYYRRGSEAYWDGRHRAMSHGSLAIDAPRAYSSMSGRVGQRPGMGPKKKLPPPKPLMLLPTPHKLKDSDFLPSTIDFAPPRVFKNQRAGTPDSGKGGMRPYAPAVRAHVPLTSSYDDLALMPSPHTLRKSGTFTALDFAPPRRFKERGETMSETGSIRSNRSNLSQMQIASIRNGAYRVSKIPKEVAGTKDDMFTALKPKWDMRGA